jgi:hypothetical protein
MVLHMKIPAGYLHPFQSPYASVYLHALMLLLLGQSNNTINSSTLILMAKPCVHTFIKVYFYQWKYFSPSDQSHPLPHLNYLFHLTAFLPSIFEEFYIIQNTAAYTNPAVCRNTKSLSKALSPQKNFVLHLPQCKYIHRCAPASTGTFQDLLWLFETTGNNERYT